MLLINPQNEYPRFYGDIQLEHPGWNLGDPLPSGWLEVTPSTPPTAPAGEILVELTPEEVNGVLTQTWTTRAMTEEELEVANAPITARQKLKDVFGLTDAEINALSRGLV